MQFRLTAILSVIILTACTQAELPATDAPSTLESANVEIKSSPVVGTWRWSGSGKSLGDIDLGEESFVFRDDGTYTVLSTSGDGASECYEGTFTWATASEPGHGTIVFKNSHVRSAAQGYARDVVLENDDTLQFGEGGTYVRTGPVLAVRCPS